ncbi:hypothetical protein [Flavihumibacter sp. CACIAM 22H1]|uniref:hypothetical protein n=1 Tax=Flavihumibacter sp. CACIAM 22H1 TaxID=1812911 RepID=UPI0007A8E800|nr:hypothetical protein [Flavihumibacter sp. CACIAM 22H1]KYP15798.1 MAG: hypothetical protein A1D16_05260 [Flavihumibacter sp. CACIAM 22H1]
MLRLLSVLPVAWLMMTTSCKNPGAQQDFSPGFRLVSTDTFHFNNFVDCNMAAAWIGDTFRIFPGKYGEDPVWGPANDLKFSSGMHADEAFSNPAAAYKTPGLPQNAPIGKTGLHGAIWFETVYQDTKDGSGKTLYAIYHNENYPETLPYDSGTGEGYINHKWPLGLTDRITPAAVCRIGIMKSTDGGWNWENRGLFLEDKQTRMILKPHNTSKTFAGGVGDPSAVAVGDSIYLFYGEYGYPGIYDSAAYDPLEEWGGQCISVARIAIADLEQPQGKAQRWDGKAFAASWDGIGKPIASLQMPLEAGGGPASSPSGGFHWGPSVSWNEYLECWVMLMGKVEGQSWVGDELFISFNRHKDLGKANHAQAWSAPQKLLEKPGHVLWYPSLQPMNTTEDISKKRTSLRLGKKARLFFKYSDLGKYCSTYIIEFEKN